MHDRRKTAFLAALTAALALGAASRSAAVNIVLDYTYDTGNFFAPGGQARAALQATATFLSGILEDTFSEIVKPPDLQSAFFDGVAYWDWSLQFTNPSGGGSISLLNQTIAADEYRIYAGAENIAGTTLGVGGPGGFNWSSNNNGGGFTNAEINQINQITDEFSAAVTTRGEASGFSAWGGSITFDTSGTVWHFDHTTPPPAGTNDFFSVAIHEMTHALGLGASDEWSALASGSHFAGAAAAAVYGSAPPLEPPNPTRGHWASGTMSTIYGTNTPQEAAMDPEITVGTRKRLTSLDAAALIDIGWTVNEPGPPTYLPADFTQDGFVNGADLTAWGNAYRLTASGNADGDGDTDGNDFLIWQRSIGMLPTIAAVPEPASAMLAALAASLLTRPRRRKS